MQAFQVVLETFTGFKAYDPGRTNPELVRNDYAEEDYKHKCFLKQALHCLDVLNGGKTTGFKEIAGNRISPPDLLLTLCHTVARRATCKASHSYYLSYCSRGMVLL